MNKKYGLLPKDLLTPYIHNFVKLTVCEKCWLYSVMVCERVKVSKLTVLILMDTVLPWKCRQINKRLTAGKETSEEERGEKKRRCKQTDA